MRRFAFPIAALGLCAGWAAAADEAAPRGERLTMVGDARTQLQDFFQTAHGGNLLEVRLSRAAEAKAQNPAVKDFARQMVNDHSTADTELRQVCQQKGITLSDQPGPFRSFAGLCAYQACEKAARRLDTLSGREFDAAFMALQVMLHMKDLALFQSGPQVLNDRDVTNVCARMEPAIRRHLEMAERICRQLETQPEGRPAAGPPAPGAPQQ